MGDDSGYCDRLPLREHQTAPEAPKGQKTQADLSQYERFQSLVEDVQDQMLLVNSGRPGKDDKDGRDGSDRDGKDFEATQTELFDLKDIDFSPVPLEKGQVLTWDGSKWTNLYNEAVVMDHGRRERRWYWRRDYWRQLNHCVDVPPHDHTEEPNSGHFHTDSSDGDLVTIFHVSDETARGNDVELLVRDLLQQGYDRIYVALADDLSQAHLYAITSVETASGFELTVSHIETAGAEPDYQNGKGYEFLFTKSAVASSGGIPEAPQDGNYYVRQNGSWINLRSALSALVYQHRYHHRRRQLHRWLYLCC